MHRLSLRRAQCTLTVHARSYDRDRHSTAQHSTAQHSTAQHSTAQRRRLGVHRHGPLCTKTRPEREATLLRPLFLRRAAMAGLGFGGFVCLCVCLFVCLFGFRTDLAHERRLRLAQHGLHDVVPAHSRAMHGTSPLHTHTHTHTHTRPAHAHAHRNTHAYAGLPLVMRRCAPKGLHARYPLYDRCALYGMRTSGYHSVYACDGVGLAGLARAVQCSASLRPLEPNRGGVAFSRGAAVRNCPNPIRRTAAPMQPGVLRLAAGNWIAAAVTTLGRLRYTRCASGCDGDKFLSRFAPIISSCIHRAALGGAGPAPDRGCHAVDAAQCRASTHARCASAPYVPPRMTLPAAVARPPALSPSLRRLMGP
jgi:hypothetical protein